MIQKMIRSIRNSLGVSILVCSPLAYVKYRYFPTPPRILEVPYEVQVERKEPPIDLEYTIKDLSQKHQVPWLLTKAIIRQEAGIDVHNIRVRYEPRLAAKSHDEAASASYGLMQVIPLYAKACRLHSWVDLVGERNIPTNIDCGLTMLHDCLQRQKGRTKAEQYRGALMCYNGGISYPANIQARLFEVVTEEG